MASGAEYLHQHGNADAPSQRPCKQCGRSDASTEVVNEMRIQRQDIHVGSRIQYGGLTGKTDGGQKPVNDNFFEAGTAINQTYKKINKR